MTTQQLCRHIICLIHAPIHVYWPDGELVTIYEDYGEQQDLFRSDPAFCRQLLERAREDMPLLFLEGDSGSVWHCAGRGRCVPGGAVLPV